MFRTTEKEVVISRSSPSKPGAYELLHKLDAVPRPNIDTEKGSFNRVYRLTEDEIDEIDEMIMDSGIGRPPAPDMGLRRSLKRVKEPYELRAAFEEVWMVLHAVVNGIHPIVHGVGIIDGRLVMIIEIGHQFNDMIEITRISGHLQWAEKLYNSLAIAAKLGLLMTDIKPGNMIFWAGKVLFIDLGSDFTRLDNGGSACILFANLLLLLLYFMCRAWTRFEYHALKFLNKKLLVLALSYRYDDAPQLCDLLRGLPSSHALRVKSPASLYSTTNVETVARAVLERAQYYSKWDRGLCVPGLKPADPVLPQLLQFISDKIETKRAIEVN